MEDDLLLSPDFYEYLHAAAPLLDVDGSLYAVSLWNDNGFYGLVQPAVDAYSVRRTSFFPGLGWLLTRELYKGQVGVCV